MKTTLQGPAKNIARAKEHKIAEISVASVVHDFVLVLKLENGEMVRIFSDDHSVIERIADTARMAKNRAKH